MAPDIPQEIKNTEVEDKYISTCKMLFATYQKSLPEVKAVVEKEMPRKQDESISAWDRRIRTEYVDVCRFILPAASIANVGVTINARALEHAISKLLSHPLEECQAIGEEMKAVAKREVPTLVKYADSLPYLQNSYKTLKKQAEKFVNEPGSDIDWCRLISYYPGGENQILAAALYRFGGESYAYYIEKVQRLPIEEKVAIARNLLDEMSAHDIPLRELEHSWFTFDIILDQGAYFELKRHRMMTQSAQTLTSRLGYTVPRKIEQANFAAIYQQAMEQARDTFEAIYRRHPYAASYIVPNGYNRRVLLSLNLRSAFHLINLRSAPNAHFSIRRIAQRMADEISKVNPVLAEFINRPSEPWQKIEKEYFTSI